MVNDITSPQSGSDLDLAGSVLTRNISASREPLQGKLNPAMKMAGKRVLSECPRDRARLRPVSEIPTRQVTDFAVGSSVDSAAYKQAPEKPRTYGIRVTFSVSRSVSPYACTMSICFLQACKPRCTLANRICWHAEIQTCRATCMRASTSCAHAIPFACVHATDDYSQSHLLLAQGVASANRRLSIPTKTFSISTFRE